MEEKVGNDKADQEADEGMTLHLKGLPNLANFYAVRHEAYKAFMRRLQTMIIKMNQADKEAREEKANKDKEEAGDPFHNDDAKKEKKCTRCPKHCSVQKMVKAAEK